MPIARVCHLLLLVLWLVPPRAALAGPTDGLPALALDLSTPRRAMATFLAAARAGDYLRAAHALDLQKIPREAQLTEGPRLSRQLGFVLAKELPDPLDLSDAPEGDPADGARTEKVGLIALGGTASGSLAVTLSRATLDDGGRAWVLSAATVAAADRLYAAYGPAWVETHLPRVVLSPQLLGVPLWQWLGLLGLLLASIVGGRLCGWILLSMGRRLAARTATQWDDRLLDALGGPLRWLLGLLLLLLLLDLLRLSAAAQDGVVQAVQILLIFNAAWVLTRGLDLLAQAVEERALLQSQQAVKDEHRLRGVRTRVAMLQRIASVVVGILAVALSLLQFQVVRSVGVSLLASAGIAGVVLGFAAQRTLGTLLGGIQLSISQPVRIGDTVVIENEQGQVEEINLTFVVVKTWDERRLVVPIDRFLEKPFQNWSLGGGEIAGPVYLHADYGLPVDAVRAEVSRLLDGNPRWDGRRARVQVTEATERTMQVRVLVSAADPDRLWDLRCELREALLCWLRSYEGGRYMPVLRVQGDPAYGNTPSSL